MDDSIKQYINDSLKNIVDSIQNKLTEDLLNSIKSELSNQFESMQLNFKDFIAKEIETNVDIHLKKSWDQFKDDKSDVESVKKPSKKKVPLSLEEILIKLKSPIDVKNFFFSKHTKYEGNTFYHNFVTNKACQIKRNTQNLYVMTFFEYGYPNKMHFSFEMPLKKNDPLLSKFCSNIMKITSIQKPPECIEAEDIIDNLSIIEENDTVILNENDLDKKIIDDDDDDDEDDDDDIKDIKTKVKKSLNDLDIDY